MRLPGRRFVSASAWPVLFALARVAAVAPVACTRVRAPAPLTSAPVVWQYEIGADPDAPGDLTIDARFAPTRRAGLGVDDDVAPFVHDVSYASGAHWIAIDGRGSTWAVPCTVGCRVRYHYGLREAASKLHDPESAMATGGGGGGATVAPPSTWLLRPEPAGGRFRFHVNTNAQWRFATGVRASPDRAADTFEAPTEALEDSAFAVFGAFSIDTIRSGTTRVDVAALSPRSSGLNHDDVVRWVETAVNALGSYYAHPFVDRVFVVVTAGEKGAPTRGETFGDGGPAVLVRAAEGLTPTALRDDWVMTHELIHASLPSLGRPHAWLGEGIATYVEPIVRARAGLVSAEVFWRDLVAGLPQGEPEQGDLGLERTHTWGRTYWGGALFCFAADVAIRARTGDLRSFDDALRGVVATGADAESHWTVERFLETGDQSTGTHVLEELYRDLALAPGTVDLTDLWQRLGVRIEAGRVVFDDGAPLAAIRRAITRPPP